MATPFLGEIRAFSFSFAPEGWALCNGQTLPINQYTALFSLLGTDFGGNGTTTFNLPDLQGRLALGSGSAVGEAVGEAAHTLVAAEMPAHDHAIAADANGSANATHIPSGTVVLGSGSSSLAGRPAIPIYHRAAAPHAPMLPLMNAGGSQPHENRMPFTVLNYCIALQGVYPSRN
jgi:microcystin-dependent protein